ncbi:MAG: insulinase family protein [Sphingobium sp.]|nr:insulinase family protein [Sphingobium sp.]
MKFVRTLFSFFAAFTLSAIALAQTAPSLTPQGPVPLAPMPVVLKQAGKWAQDYLGRQADPAVRFGTLANGLRYALLKNDTPKNAVAMRMLIGSGSLKEREEERGLAHFLEHMAFRGSTNVPDGEIVRMLERHGLRFGPDTNASTSFERTLYMFNFPKATPDALDTGLTLFREIGERLKLDPAAVEAEKGVVLSEERLRDTPAYKAAKANVSLLLAGTLAPERWAIGTVETVKAATPERLRRYYEANYRPENAVIVIVGAIDVDQVEAKIKSGFTDWRGKGEPDRLAQVAPKPDKNADEFVADGAPDELSLNWVRPVDRRAETLAVDRERVRRMLAARVMNNRLSDRALRPGNPFASASLSLSDSLLDSASLASLAIQADPSRWRPALDAALEEQRMLLRDGVTADDFQRATNSLLASLQASADGAPTRRNESLADGIVGAALDDELYTSPAQNLAMVRAFVADETPETVTAAMRAIFAGTPPLVFRSARSDPATAPALETALAAAQVRALPAGEIRVAVSWPYGDFGKPGTVVSRRDDKALGATIVTFANGTRLIVKQTDFEKDRVNISVGFGTGQSSLSPALAHANWAVGLFTMGGTGKLSLADVRRIMQTQGKLGSVSATLGATRLWVNGGTRPRDFGTEMQLIAAFVTDPGFRPELGDQLRTMAPMLKTRIDTSAGSVFARGLVDLLQGNDRRFASTPSDADIDATMPADLPAIVRPMLKTPADIAIVGDLSVGEAIRETAATLGAVPRMARPAEPRPRVTMPPGRTEPFIFRHGGRADQAYYGLVWQLPDFFTDQKLSRTADVAAALIKARLVDTVREKLGLTYSPGVSAAASIELSGLGYLLIQTETPPDKFEAMRGAVLEAIANLVRDSIGDDELDRAKKPLIEATQKARETNAFWARNLSLLLREPRARDHVLNETKELGAVTSADVKALLTRYLSDKTPLTVISQAR